MQNAANCTGYLENMSADCYKTMLLLFAHAHNEGWAQYKNSRENKIGADMYTIVILGLFATVILCLLFRSVKKSENADDQVLLLLSSMQIHVDFEERERHRKKMKEEKDKTQSFISDLAMRSFRRFARSRSASHVNVKERPSVCSVPNTRPYSPFQTAPHRARSYQGYLPEIVVTEHHQPKGNLISVPRSQPMTPVSRQSSSGSYGYRQGSETGSVFLFPDGIAECNYS